MIPRTTKTDQLSQSARRTGAVRVRLPSLAVIGVLAAGALGMGNTAGLAQTLEDRAVPGAIDRAQNNPDTSANSAPRPPRVRAPSVAALRDTRGPVAQPRAAVVSATGCNSEGALGVSRVVEIDTSSSHKYGHQQQDVEDFLQDHEVVLTFDDGPLRPYTTPVLKALDNHCTKATFFVVGRMAVADPAMVRETAKRGHTIGSHTWSHMDLRKTNSARAKGELELGISAVSKALGTPAAPFFRFPYLSAAKSVVQHAQTRNISIFSIDVDSEDYRTKDPGIVHRRVLNGLKSAGRGIILFHDIQPSTAHALQGILDELKAQGFKVVHVVPKAPVVTQPQFDEMAAREFDHKSQAASDDPLASRSIVWAAQGSRENTRAGAGGPRPADTAEVLPWGTTAVQQETIVPDAKRRPPPLKTDDGDWFTNLFKN